MNDNDFDDEFDKNTKTMWSVIGWAMLVFVAITMIFIYKS